MANKVTKRQLLSSALALTVSGTMLLGTTMAWFTDTVTTGVNVIKTGKLKIEASVGGTKLTDKTTEINLSGETEVLNPGGTLTKEVTVKNNGTVDATVKVTAESKEKNVDENSKESEHSNHLQIKQPASKTIKAGTEDTFTIVFTLSKDCNQQEAVLKAQLHIQADQLQNVVTVTDATELETALASAESGTYINLVNTKITSEEAVTYTVPDGVTLDGGIFTGKTALKVGNNAVIKNVTMDVPENGIGVALEVTGENVTLDNVNVKGAKYAVRIDRASGTHTITNCNFESPTHYAFNYNGDYNVQASIEFTNTTFQGWTSYHMDGSVTFTNCTFKDGSVKNFLKAYADTTLQKCTFEDEFEFQPVDARSINMNFNECIYKDASLTAPQLKDLACVDQDWNTSAKVYLNREEVVCNTPVTQE